MEYDPADDNTAVIRMKKDFDDFLSQNRSQSRQGCKLSFGSSYLDRSRSDMEKVYSGGVSMKDVFDKEKETQQRQLALLQSKTEITELKSQISSLETSRKRSRVEYEQELDNIKLVHKQELEKYTDLKHQVHMLTIKEAETREEWLEYRKASELAKASLEQKLTVLQKEKFKLESEHQETEHNLRQKLSDLKSESLRQSAELQICRDKLNEANQQLALNRRKCTEMSQKLEEMEQVGVKAVTYEHKIKDLEHQLSRVHEDSTIASAMKSQIVLVPELQKENKKLKEDNAYYMDTQENILLLREQNDSLKKKLQRSEQRCSELQERQIKYDELKKKVEKWEGVDLKGISRPQSPTRVLITVGELQNTNAVLLEKQGQLSSNVHSLQQQLQTKKQQLQTTQEQLHKDQYKMQQALDQLRRVQKKLMLITMERDGYKNIIESYESEVTVNVTAAATQRMSELEQINQAYHRKMKDLEAEINSKEEQFANLRNKCYMLEKQFHELPQGGQSFSTLQVPSEADQKLIATLREKIADLEKTLEKVTEEKELLEARIDRCNLQGDYDPTKTKVVHLSMNPLSLAQMQRAKKMTRLEEENEKLKKRIEVLEESGGQVQDITTVVEQKMQEPSSSKELEEMKQQLSSAELKNKRLMEAFGKTSQEFREVCYQLLGYKMDIPVSKQYRLMSMYAESPEDYLLFQQAQNGEMQLLGTAYSETLEDKMESYLHGANSIPAFLSSLTLDLFNRQTIVQ